LWLTLHSQWNKFTTHETVSLELLPTNLQIALFILQIPCCYSCSQALVHGLLHKEPGMRPWTCLLNADCYLSLTGMATSISNVPSSHDISSLGAQMLAISEHGKLKKVDMIIRKDTKLIIKCSLIMRGRSLSQIALNELTTPSN